jgi:hypothetical protein
VATPFWRFWCIFDSLATRFRVIPRRIEPERIPEMMCAGILKQADQTTETESPDEMAERFCVAD